MPVAGLTLFICCLVLAFVDLFCVLIRGTGNSVSNFMLNLGFGTGRFVVYAFGCTNGHLFFYMYQQGTPDPFWPRMFDAACGGVFALCAKYLIDWWRGKK